MTICRPSLEGKTSTHTLVSPQVLKRASLATWVRKRPRDVKVSFLGGQLDPATQDLSTPRRCAQQSVLFVDFLFQIFFPYSLVINLAAIKRPTSFVIHGPLWYLPRADSTHHYFSLTSQCGLSHGSNVDSCSAAMFGSSDAIQSLQLLFLSQLHFLEIILPLHIIFHSRSRAPCAAWSIHGQVLRANVQTKAKRQNKIAALDLEFRLNTSYRAAQTKKVTFSAAEPKPTSDLSRDKSTFSIFWQRS